MPRLSVDLTEVEFEAVTTCIRLGTEDTMAAVARAAIILYAQRLEETDAAARDD